MQGPNAYLSRVLMVVYIVMLFSISAIAQSATTSSKIRIDEPICGPAKKTLWDGDSRIYPMSG